MDFYLNIIIYIVVLQYKYNFVIYCYIGIVEEILIHQLVVLHDQNRRENLAVIFFVLNVYSENRSNINYQRDLYESYTRNLQNENLLPLTEN